MCALALGAANATAGVSAAPYPTWLTDGPVQAVLPLGDRVYIGGRFSYVGPVTGSGAVVGRRSGHLVSRFPSVAGSVLAAVSDGAGGYYIGGRFDSVGGLARRRLAHVKADGTVDRGWHPDATGTVNALARFGSTLFVGGEFGKIAGQRRARIAALNAHTGRVTAWNAHVVGCADCGPMEVRTLAVSGSTVYFGGSFESVRGQERFGLAAVDARTAAVLAWHPTVIDYTTALTASGPNVYVAGREYIGEDVVTVICGFDVGKGSDPVWKVRVGSGSSVDVTTLALAGSRLYAGGEFTRIAGGVRRHLAALDRRTGALTSWNPRTGATKDISIPAVNAIAATKSTVFIGGRFTSVGSRQRSNVAELSARSGVASSWMPGTDGGVDAVALSGSTVYVGGDFLSAGGRQRQNLAALDAHTGAATSWNPGANGAVNTMAHGIRGIYVGGDFTGIGGGGRKNLAVLSPLTGHARAWNPSPNRPVYALAVAGSTVYVGGSFTRIAGRARARIAALDAYNGGATDWNPGANKAVHALAVSGSRLYVGGAFTRIGGRERSLIAAIGRSTGAVSSWNPSAHFQGNCDDRFGASQGCGVGPTVLGLAVSGSRVYVAGAFTSIGGRDRNYLAAVDAASGAATSWNPDARATAPSYDDRPYDYATTVVVAGRYVYVGGSFGAAELSAATARPSGWDPKLYGVQALAVSGSRLYVGSSNRYVGSELTDSGFSSYGLIAEPGAPPPGLG